MSKQTNTLDISVKIYPAQDAESLLATASVTLGGCFAIRGVRIVDSEKGAFVSMPQRKNSNNEYRDVCFPTTPEMREALNAAVLDEYQRAAERNFSRAAESMEKRTSVLAKLREKRAEAPKRQKPVPVRGKGKGAR